MIYLLHSTVPLGGEGRNSASHYLGWCEDDDLVRRVKQHQSGTSDVAIVRAFHAAGAQLKLSAVWPGKTRDDERKMKKAGHLDRHCSVCHPRVGGERP